MLWLGEAVAPQPNLSRLLPGALSPPCAPNFASGSSCPSAGTPSCTRGCSGAAPSWARPGLVAAVAAQGGAWPCFGLSRSPSAAF